MNAQDFTYWLQGFVELNKGQVPGADQWKSIKEHLALVFTKVTPPVGKFDPLPPGHYPPFLPSTYPTPGWPPSEVICSTTNPLAEAAQAQSIISGLSVGAGSPPKSSTTEFC